MPIASRLRSLWRNLLYKQEVDGELHSELSSFVAELTDEKIRQGMSPEGARRAALLETGGVEQVKEEVRDVRTGALLDTLMQDLRYGLRMLAKNPGFTLAAIVALALGIGANTSIFSVVNAVLLRPLPYYDPDRLVVLLHRGNNPVAPANYLDWRAQSQSFESMGAAEAWSGNASSGDHPEHLQGIKLTSSMFTVLGVQPLLGRGFTRDEEITGQDHSIVLTYQLWQQRFGANTDVIGQTMLLNGEPYVIVGVMPQTFQFAPFWQTKAQLFIPLALDRKATSRGGQSLRIFARLKPVATLDQARAEVATITGRLEQQFPGTNRDVRVIPLREKVVGDVRPALLVMLGAVGFVLLISCANVAHMLLARAAARKKEIAVRIALGARRARLIRQFLTESLLLSFAAGVAGLLLGMWGIRVLVALSPDRIPRVNTVTLDVPVLLFTLGISLFTGIAFGLAPAIQASAVGLSGSLKESERGSTETVRKNRLRSLLIASEFSLALVLLVGAGLMIRSFIALGRIDPGFVPDHVLTMIVSVSGTQQVDPVIRTNFYQEAIQRVQALPGVTSVSAINHIPLAGDLWGFPYIVEGRPVPAKGEVPAAVFRVIMPGYFHTMQVPFVRGREFTSADTLNSPGLVVINETLARLQFPGEDPIGKRMALNDSLDGAEWLTVVGIVRDVKQDRWSTPADSEVYVSFLQSKPVDNDPAFMMRYLTLVLRTTGDAADAAPAVRNAIWSIDKTVTLAEVQTMDDIVANANAQPRFYLVLLGTFACVALVLAGVGMYAVMSYSVSRRTHEIGIRMALGAKRSNVLGLVIRQGLTVALIGAAFGLVGSLLTTRLMISFLYGVQPRDPLTLVGVWFVLTSVALLACYIPARRATRVDPMVALRYE